MNKRLPESRFLVLNPHTRRGGGRLLRMVIHPNWAHVVDNKPSNNYPIGHKRGTFHRDQRCYDIGDCIPIVVCHWAEFIRSSAHHEVKFQELPCIQHEDSRIEEKNDTSADNIDSSRRIGPCLPWTPGQSLFIVLADMYAQDPQSFHRSNR